MTREGSRQTFRRLKSSSEFDLLRSSPRASSLRQALGVIAARTDESVHMAGSMIAGFLQAAP
jgi:hypothetical protein